VGWDVGIEAPVNFSRNKALGLHARLIAERKKLTVNKTNINFYE